MLVPSCILEGESVSLVWGSTSTCSRTGTGPGETVVTLVGVTWSGVSSASSSVIGLESDICS